MVNLFKNLFSFELGKKVQLTCQVFLAGLLGSICLTVGLLGCSKRYNDLPTFSAIPIRDYPNESVGRFKTSYLVEQFDEYYRGTNPGPIGITTFVNLDDLYTTSTFGRMLGEQVISELAMRGYDVIELRHSDALQFLSTSGEFALSRDVGFVRRERELGGVVVGTYVTSPERVYVNARLIDPATSRVLTAGSVEMDKTREIAKMLRGGSVTASLERIPVKHLGFSTLPINIFNSGGSQLREIEDPAPFQNSALSSPVQPRLADLPPLPSSKKQH